jgi:hypothetical protein
MLYVGVGVAAAIAIFLVALIAGPAILGSGSTVTGAAVLTYSGAHPVANSAVGGFSGGGWTLLFAAGLVSPTTEVAPLNASSLLSGVSSYCTVTLVSPLAGLTLPGYTGNRSLGASPAWEFGYRNSTGGIAIVSVIDGHGTVLATLSGLECGIGSQLFTPVPGDVIDSSVAAVDVAPAAHAFLAAYPNASAVYGLIGGVHEGTLNLGTEWSIEYSTCALNATATGTGSEFNATLDGVTGKILATATTNDVSCGGSTVSTAYQLNTSPVLGSEQVSAALPHENISWPVEFEENGIAWENLVISGVGSFSGTQYLPR